MSVNEDDPTNLEVAAEAHTRPLAIIAALLRALSTIQSGGSDA